MGAMLAFCLFIQDSVLNKPVLHGWCNKGHGMCYPVCGMVHIKEPLLLINKSSICGGSGFPFSLTEWSLTICLSPYNRRSNVLSASLNKTFLSLSSEQGRKEGNILFNDALNTLYLRLYCVRHMVKYHSTREKTCCHHMSYTFQ